MIRNTWLFIIPGIILSSLFIPTKQYDYSRKGIKVKDNIIDLAADTVTINLQPGCSKDICDPNPCRHGSLCALTQTMDDYKCFCIFPADGRRCEYLGPSCRYYDTAIQYDDTMYMIYPHYNCTAIDAALHCQNYDMQLADFQNKSILEFVVGKLKEFFSPAIHKNYRFAMWIGLNKTNCTEPWRWNENAPLNYTDKWAPGRPTDKTDYLFASIRHDETLKYLMHDEPIGGEEGWVHFPLCRYHMPFYEGNTSMESVPDSIKKLI